MFKLLKKVENVHSMYQNDEKEGKPVQSLHNDQQSIERVRRAVERGDNLINYLIEYANEKPNIVQKQSFCYDNIKRLIDAISKGNSCGVYSYDNHHKKIVLNEEKEEYNTEYNSRQLQLATLYIKKAVEIFEEQFKRLYNREFDERLEILKRASKYAEELAFPYRIEKRSEIKYIIRDPVKLECEKCKRKRAIMFPVHKSDCQCQLCIDKRKESMTVR
jgi:hypothetical protein